MEAEALSEEPIPFHRAAVGEEEIAEVTETIRSGWLTMGPRTRELEESFARALGARHAVAVSSCTAALHLGLDALGIGAGDEVITSAYTFTSTVATILHAGARPVLADCRDDTLCIDPDDVRRKITPRTRAIVPVHFGGHPADMDALQALADEHGLAILEDAAHALPARLHGRPVGTLGTLTAFSFYATKCITTGEGGMVTTADDALAERMRTRRLHGMSRDAWRRYTASGSWRYDVTYPGFKYNMTDINAALGLVQLRKMDRLRDARLRIARLYDEVLAEVPQLRTPVTLPEVHHAWHLFVLRIRRESDISRDDLMEGLKKRGVGVSQHFIPIPELSFYREHLGVRSEEFPVATAAGAETLSLPIYPDLSDDDARRVALTVRGLVERSGATS